MTTKSSKHLAIFTPPFIDLILEGKKTIESRFSKVRCAPFGVVKEGDIVLMKQSGGLVIGEFTVARVVTFTNLKDITGIGGYCPSAHFVQISIDPKNPEFKKHYKEALERTLSHELHHAVRQGFNAEIFDGTLLECVFSEGLADYFSYEITGKRPVWAEDLIEKETKRIMQKIRPKLNKRIEDEDYYEWFLSGSKKDKIPKWAGYAIGFNLVKKYLEQNPEKSAASLVSVPAKAVFKNSQLPAMSLGLAG